MKVTDLLDRKQESWRELETAIETLSQSRRWKRPTSEQVLRFGALYRMACADLALAQSYRLPEETIQYLHQLVGNAHNVLYRSQRFRFRDWGKTLFVDVPRRLFQDGYLRISFLFFWGAFFASMLLAYMPGDFARQVAGAETLEAMEEMYAKPLGEMRGEGGDTMMVGFYIFNNAGIGLRCFVMGIFFGVGSIATLAFNGVYLGTIFGYMIHSTSSANFYEFVTAHGPFELTAVVLSGAAGLRLGFSMIDTKGATRMESLRREGRNALEIIVVASILFFLAAFVEGYISPSPLPYSTKAAVAIVSGLLLVVYIIVLGWGGTVSDAT